jgi:hypothetical protein
MPVFMHIVLHTMDVEATGLLTLMEHGIHIPHDEQKASVRKVQEKMHKVLHALTYYTTDDCHLHRPQPDLLRTTLCTLTIIIQHLHLIES